MCGLVVWVCFTVLGVIALASLVLVSSLLLSLCLLFSLDFFGVNRKSLTLNAMLFGVLVILLFEMASFVLFSVPVSLGLAAGGLGFHWSGVELAFANLGYPFLPYVYFLFVLLGFVGLIFRLLPRAWLWLDRRIRGRGFGRFSDMFELDDGDFGFLNGRLVVVLAVVGSAVISCLFVLFTVLSRNNPTGMLVSVDSPIYYSWITHMQSVDVNSALSFAFR